MKIDLMALADIGNPQKLAEEIVSQLPSLEPPVPVEEIAFAVGIKNIEDVVTEGFLGGLIKNVNKSSGTILVNVSVQGPRRRFTIGHELGHFLNPWHKSTNKDGVRCKQTDFLIDNFAENDRAAKMEVEANYFAGELLLPRNLFRRDMRQESGVDIDQILELAEKYEVSREATARRYVILQDEPCAVVFSHEGRVRYIGKHKEFPWLAVGPGDLLPSQSIASQSIGPVGKVSELNQTDSGIWFEEPLRSAVYEQTIVQQDGFRMTLLSIDEDEDLDFDELEESWTPRFKR